MDCCFCHRSPLNSSSVSAKQPDKELKQPRRLAAKINVLRDGGSRAIEIPAHGTKPACKIYVDYRLGTKSPGEVFLSKDFKLDGQGKPDEHAKPLSWEQANDLLKQLEQVLIAHYGSEKLLEFVLNPIEVGALSDEEFMERTKDPEFNDAMDARYLMDAIISYRTKHGPAAKRD